MDADTPSWWHSRAPVGTGLCSLGKVQFGRIELDSLNSLKFISRGIRSGPVTFELCETVKCFWTMPYVLSYKQGESVAWYVLNCADYTRKGTRHRLRDGWDIVVITQDRSRFIYPSPISTYRRSVITLRKTFVIFVWILLGSVSCCLIWYFIWDSLS